jgi:hypothetical protein
LYGGWTLSLALKIRQWFKMSEKRLLNGLFGPLGEEITKILK